MFATLLFALSALFCAYSLCWRFLPTQNHLQRAALCPLVAASLVIAAANLWGPVACRLPFSAIFVVLGGLSHLPMFRQAGPETESKLWWGQGLFLSSVGLYVAYTQWRFLDTDNWIHEPLIGGYTLGLFPPVHPFFPEASMNGHYGRDLLIGSLTPQGADPLVIVWLLNPLLAVCSALLLVQLFERAGHHRVSALMASVFGFFGMCVGFRVGLVDTTDGNNGLVYAQAILLFYLMLEVLELLPQRPEKSAPGLWLISGFVLGTYQLVYETHFGLFLMTAAALLPLALQDKAHRKRVLTGVFVTASLALLLAATEGGPITDLVHSRAVGQKAISGTADDQVSDLNVEQHVSIKFPKKDLFKVRATTADYQRLSVGFKSGPFQGLAPPIKGEGYLSIFHPQFLVTHWLPLFLAPLTLYWLLRQKHWAGLSFWLFGLCAYFVPGLFDFGPVYEWEYFRWEFAAGFGWAVALGAFCGDLLVSSPPASAPVRQDEEHGWTLQLHRGHSLFVLGLMIALVGLLPGEKLLNNAIIDIQKHGLPGPVRPSSWRVAQKDLGVQDVDLQIAAELSKVIQPGDRVMTNLGNETPFGLWPDCVLAGLTGARISGRARPPVDRRVHAHPNYHRSKLWKAVRHTRRVDLLLASDTRWLVIDPEVEPWSDILEDSKAFQLLKEVSSAHGRRQLWLVDSSAKLPESELSQELEINLQDSNEWRTATVYELDFSDVPSEGSLSLTIEDVNKASRYPSLNYRMSPDTKGPIAFVTPLEEGQFELVGRSGEREVFRKPLRVDFRQRLSQLQAQIEVPGALPPKTMTALNVSLRSDSALKTEDELTLLLRFRRDGGDYVWEMDRVPIPLNLNLKAAETSRLDFPIMTPWEGGAYILELEVIDKRTGLRTPIKQETPARLLVATP